MKSVEKIIAVLSEFLMVASLVACNGNKEPEIATAASRITSLQKLKIIIKG